MTLYTLVIEVDNIWLQTTDSFDGCFDWLRRMMYEQEQMIPGFLNTMELHQVRLRRMWQVYPK